eukprot:343054_1
MGNDVDCNGLGGYDDCLYDSKAYWNGVWYSTNPCGWCFDYHNITNNSKCIDQETYCLDKSMCRDFEYPDLAFGCQAKVNWSYGGMLLIGILVGMCMCTGAAKVLESYRPQRAKMVKYITMGTVLFGFWIYLMVVMFRWVALRYNSVKHQQAEDMMNWSLDAVLLIPLLIIILLWTIDVFARLIARVKIVVRTSGNKKCLYSLIFCIIVTLFVLTGLCAMNLTNIDWIGKGTRLMSIELLIVDLASLAAELETKISFKTLWIKSKFIFCGIGDLAVIMDDNAQIQNKSSVQISTDDVSSVLLDDSKQNGAIQISSDNDNSSSVNDSEHHIGDNVNLSDKEAKITGRIWILFICTLIIIAIITCALIFEEEEPCILNFGAFLLFMVDVTWYILHMIKEGEAIGCAGCWMTLVGITLFVLSLLTCTICDPEEDECENWHYLILSLIFLCLKCRDMIKCDCC